jgi:hypothetical protein
MEGWGWFIEEDGAAMAMTPRSRGNLDDRASWGNSMRVSANEPDGPASPFLAGDELGVLLDLRYWGDCTWAQEKGVGG